jgi:hypothetical protein
MLIVDWYVVSRVLDESNQELTKDAVKLTEALQDVVNNANGVAAVQLDVDIQEIECHDEYQKRR